MKVTGRGGGGGGGRGHGPYSESNVKYHLQYIVPFTLLPTLSLPTYES